MDGIKFDQIYLPQYDIDFYTIKRELIYSGFPQRRGYLTFTRIQGIQGGGQPRCQCGAVKILHYPHYF